MPTDILSVEHLSFGYDGETVFEDFSLAIAEGGVTLLNGANGAGKTTLCDIVSGVLDAENVGCFWRSSAIEQRQLRQLTSYASQDPEFFPALTGRENLELVGLLSTEPSSYVESARAVAVGLGLGRRDLDEKLVGAYSGGMQQKLWIAAQLARARDLVILDEPFSSLDADSVQVVCEMLRASQRSVLLVSHLIPECLEVESVVTLPGP